MEKIHTDKAPNAVGPYSQAVKYQQLVFTAGQVPINPSTNKLVTAGIEAQARQVLENLKEVLKAAGTSLDKALKVTIYLKNMEDYHAINSIYASYFTNRPARSTVEVARLPKDVLIEMDVIAACDER